MGLIFYTHSVSVHAEKNEGLENTVYVSISGKSMGADGSLDNPFPSIEDARDYLRTKDLDAKNRGLIYLCGGRYRVVESIKLTAEDSYITLAAYQGEPVEISGSLTLNNGNFKKLSEVKGDKYSSAVRLQSSVSDKVYVYDLGAENIPAGVIYKNGFNWKKQPFQSELVVDGVLQVLAQYPNSGVMTENNIGRQDFGEKVRMYYFDKTDDAKTYEEMLQMRAPVWDVNSLSPNYKSWAPPYVDNWTEEDNKAGQPDINPNTDNTRYETDGWLSGYFENNYANDRVRIYSIKDASATSNAKDWIYCKYPSMYSVTKRRGVIRLHAINLLCELDMEGEYYIDRYKGNDILYYYPKGGTIGNKSISFTAFDQPLLTLEKAEGVQIRGIKFSGTTSYGITMMDCVSCAVKSCELYNISLDAIRIGMNNGTITSDPSYKTWGGGYKNLVYNCTIHDMGGGGVFLAGGDRKSLKRGDNLVRNCEFYNLSRLATYTPAVYLEGVGNTAAYNYIHDCPHMVIQIMGNDMLVTHNKIVNTCYNASDQAPIYSGRDWGWLGNQITYNYIDTVRASHGSNYGIYMDDGLSGMIIRNNIIRSVKGKAVFANKGYGHYVTDNIIIDCRSYLEVWQFVRDGKYRPVANEKVMAYRFFYGLRSYEEAVASGDEANKSTKGYYNTAENIRKWYKHYNALYNNLPDYSKKKEHAFDLSKKYLPLGFVRNKDNYSEHSMWSDKNSILVASNITAVRNILVKTGGLLDAQDAKNYNDPDTFNVKVHKADSADALGLDLATGKISIQSPLAKDKNYGSDWIKEWNGTFDVEKAGTIADMDKAKLFN